LKRGGAGDGEERPAAALAVVQGSWLKVRGDPDRWDPPISERVTEREGGERWRLVLGRVGRKRRGEAGRAGRKRRWPGSRGRLDRFVFFFFSFFLFFKSFLTHFKFKSSHKFFQPFFYNYL
jgi:hypothetical protein